jgi:hypothetical protein
MTILTTYLLACVGLRVSEEVPCVIMLCEGPGDFTSNMAGAVSLCVCPSTPKPNRWRWIIRSNGIDLLHLDRSPALQQQTGCAVLLERVGQPQRDPQFTSRSTKHLSSCFIRKFIALSSLTTCYCFSKYKCSLLILDESQSPENP